ncbi:hypothetical protein ABOM_009640 [Aspergillus bombycis]|uniref:Uncharacterized protein n=1 Tax=Aspergillus bombycis TaxID=109264 RepID=A0A1F7ZQU5_9EURO|nr:hypothetical protein ABOM_009640 [Aspergillus bombycis]OGM41830.1 hypothetical protein ABOM_009640 [Aspergillus bombycis]
MDQQLTSTQKANLHEIADLMLEIYQTLANMRFLNPAGIIKGPHNTDNALELYQELGLDPSIIYLYSILPYIESPLAGQPDFFKGGIFTDFRRLDDIEEGRDPFHICPGDDDYEDEDGPYMRPWVTPLSLLGNHQSVILYDARRHQIWIIDQESWNTTDPALRNSSDRAAGDEYEYDPLVSFIGDNAWWWENSGREWDSDELPLRELYSKHGWPDNFNGDAFEIDQLRLVEDAQRQNGEDAT